MVNYGRGWWLWFHGSFESTRNFSQNFTEALWGAKTCISKIISASWITLIKFGLKSRSWFTFPGKSKSPVGEGGISTDIGLRKSTLVLFLSRIFQYLRIHVKLLSIHPFQTQWHSVPLMSLCHLHQITFIIEYIMYNNMDFINSNQFHDAVAFWKVSSL